MGYLEIYDMQCSIKSLFLLLGKYMQYLIKYLFCFLKDLFNIWLNVSFREKYMQYLIKCFFWFLEIYDMQCLIKSLFLLLGKYTQYLIKCFFCFLINIFNI